MVEYLRLLNGDSLRQLFGDWRGPHAVVVGAILVVIVVLGYLIVRRK